MKKCKECGRDEWGFLSSLNEDGLCPTCAFHHNQDKIKRLQEQIKEANELIKECCKRIEFRQVCLTSFPPKFKIDDYLYNELEDYFKKYGINWGIK